MHSVGCRTQGGAHVRLVAVLVLADEGLKGGAETIDHCSPHPSRPAPLAVPLDHTL
jgi:hypothetical protein